MSSVERSLLGLSLETAQAKARENGLELRVETSRSPRCAEDRGTPRVVRVKDGVLTVCYFPVGAPET